MKYAIVFEQGPTSVGATVPDLPGCVAIGDTVEEARSLIAEAIEGHIAVMRQFGEPVPQPSTLTEMLEVTR